jgi:hypothetical protein
MSASNPPHRSIRRGTGTHPKCASYATQKDFENLVKESPKVIPGIPTAEPELLVNPDPRPISQPLRIFGRLGRVTEFVRMRAAP